MGQQSRGKGSCPRAKSRHRNRADVRAGPIRATCGRPAAQARPAAGADRGRRRGRFRRGRPVSGAGRRRRRARRVRCGASSGDRRPDRAGRTAHGCRPPRATTARRAAGADDRRRDKLRAPLAEPIGGVVAPREKAPSTEPRRLTAASSPVNPPLPRAGASVPAGAAEREGLRPASVARAAHRSAHRVDLSRPATDPPRKPATAAPSPTAVHGPADSPVVGLITAPLPYVVDIVSAVPIRPVVVALLRVADAVLPPALGAVTVPAATPPLPVPPVLGPAAGPVTDPAPPPTVPTPPRGTGTGPRTRRSAADPGRATADVRRRPRACHGPDGAPRRTPGTRWTRGRVLWSARHARRPGCRWRRQRIDARVGAGPAARPAGALRCRAALRSRAASGREPNSVCDRPPRLRRVDRPGGWPERPAPPAGRSISARARPPWRCRGPMPTRL